MTDYPHSSNSVIGENRLWLVTGCTHKGEKFSFVFLGTSIDAVVKDAIANQTAISPDQLMLKLTIEDITPQIVEQYQVDSKMLICMHMHASGSTRSN